MEYCTIKSLMMDITEAYSKRLKKITATKDSNLNFQIPQKLLEARKKTWNHLFDKYTGEMSDDMPDVESLIYDSSEGEEKSVTQKECNYRQQVSMRKSATLIQYWINTGNLPYETLLDENKMSETGSSLSEKEIPSTVINAINAEDKQKCKNDSYCSSVEIVPYSIHIGHRKKLYTDRDSPVDLTLIKTQQVDGTSRLSEAAKSLHPALEPGNTIERGLSLTHDEKNKHSLSAKKDLDFKKAKMKERKKSNNISDKIITDNNEIAQKEDVCNNKHLDKKLYSCNIENLGSETKDSDESTIFIEQCLATTSQCASSLSDCFLDLRKRKNIQDDVSALKLREVRVVLERLPANTCLKESSNVINTNIFPEKEISNTDLHTNHKQESQIEKIEQNQVSDKESESTSQYRTLRHKNRSKASPDNHRKYLDFTSSDEDDFVRSIKYPRKRLKVSINNISDEPDITEKGLNDKRQIHDITKSKLIYKKTKTNERLPNKFNGDTKLRINDMRKHVSFINSTRDISVKEKTLSNTLGIFEESLDSLQKNKEISDKSKNSVVVQQDDVTSTVKELLIFQTKSYYDSSDSDEIM